MLTTEFKMEDAIAVWKEEGAAYVIELLESGYTIDEIKEILHQERDKSHH